jgi:hypothetical protein
MNDDFTNLLNWVADTATSLTRAFDECATMIPNDLFTAMRFHPESMEVERLFSTLPDIYPINGRKPKRQTEWGQNVLIQQQINLGCGPEAIAWAFSDHKTILGLGLNAVLNVPVVSDGSTLGTINFLRKAPAFDAKDVAIGTALAASLARRGKLV